MRFLTNRKSSLWLFAIVIGLAVMVYSTPPSWACGHHKQRQHPDAADYIRHLLMAKDALGLTEEQAMRLHTMKIEFKKGRITKKAEVDLATVDMHAIQHDTQSSMSDIEAAVKKVYVLKADFHLLSVRTRQDAKSVLTPEQQDKMKSLHSHKSRKIKQQRYQGEEQA